MIRAFPISVQKIKVPRKLWTVPPPVPSPSITFGTYTYDNNGNTLSRSDASGVTQYAWDVENRLTSVTLPNNGGVVTFEYDPFGRRIQKSSAAGTTIYVYDGANVVGEYDGTGAVTAKYAQGAGIDEPLAMWRGGQVGYYNADGLGSVTSVIDSTLTPLATYSYDAFGKKLTTGGSLTNPFQYTGREWDQETGLYYYRARYYDPQVGRFISEDPVMFVGGHNFYGYVGNEPTTFVDPSGLAKTCKIPPIGPHSKLPTPITKCASKNLVDCIVQTESSGNPNAVSKKGASGLMQTTSVAISELKQQGLYQPGMTGMQVGTTYINLLVSYCTNVTAALAAYNAGPTAVNAAGGVPNYPETQNYVKKIDTCLQKKGLSGGVNDSGATCGCK